MNFWPSLFVTSLIVCQVVFAEGAGKDSAKQKRIRLTKQEKQQVEKLRDDIELCVLNQSSKFEKECFERFPYPDRSKRPPKPFKQCLEKLKETERIRCGNKLATALPHKPYQYWRYKYGPDKPLKRAPGEGRSVSSVADSGSDKRSLSEPKDEWVTEFGD